ncbi:hypothetical protein HKT18_00295 [Flavobacterium sp. IMCC34852]|uniref:DUF1311 domain-containing protein n=1 Tax=Flavobacterium rivulicola TaxID=2732161 RepID=A0A7Y3R662_9FLAO|nr:hypothetical protein [Flavobacterium sp. IMCC34852]NNT70643.1 hypothetical protein [Flavobacterium sp. IMCC34852]
MFKKSFFVWVSMFWFEVICGQTQATLDSLMVEYNECLSVRKDRVNCTKELFWAYQDLQFDFHNQAIKRLDSINQKKKNLECREWIGTKDFFVGNEIIKFQRKHPNEKISAPSKAAENDAYIAFKNICDFIMIRLKRLMVEIESSK